MFLRGGLLIEPWKPFKSYTNDPKIQDVVLYDNIIYVCSVAHRSGATFNENANKFISAGSGGGSGGSGGTGSSNNALLIESDWDIVSTTVTYPPSTLPVKLSNGIDATFSEVNDIQTISAVIPLTQYPNWGGHIFGGYQNNIDALTTNFKEITIKNFTNQNNDFIGFAFTSLSYEDFLSNLLTGNPINSLIFRCTSFGSTQITYLLINGNGDTIVIDSFTQSTLETFDVSIRINMNEFEIYKNNTLILGKNFISDPEENWQNYLGPSINLIMFSINIPSLVERLAISYTTPIPFTKIQSLTVTEPPIDAEDGKLYKLISNGVYNGNILYIDDRVIFQNDLQDVIIMRHYADVIPNLQLNAFINQVYERGIIDDVFSTMPSLLTSFVQGFTFWVIDQIQLYAIHNNQAIVIPILDNTFRIKNSGLLLERNDTGMILPSQNIQIVDTVHAYIDDMILNSEDIQISEENKNLKRIKEYFVWDFENYFEFNIPDMIGDVKYTFNNNTTNVLTLNLINNPYNTMLPPAYNYTTNNTILLHNNTDDVKQVIFSGFITINNIINNSILIKPRNTTIVTVVSKFTQFLNDSWFTAHIDNISSIITTLYVDGTSTSYFDTHTTDIIISSSNTTVVINGVCTSPSPHKIFIYNSGNAVDVELTVNGGLFLFSLPPNQKRELMILDSTFNPLGFLSGVLYQ